MNKKTLKELVETIAASTGMSASDIALEMGYKKNYISEMLTPSGKVTEKFITKLKLKYSYLLDNPKLSKENSKSFAMDFSDNYGLPPEAYREKYLEYKEKYLRCEEEMLRVQREIARSGKVTEIFFKKAE